MSEEAGTSSLAPTADNEATTAATRAAEQARIRKERREAKIKAGGSARLNKITGLGGGIQKDLPASVPASTLPARVEASDAAAANNAGIGDPAEVDISDHFHVPTSSSARRAPSNSNGDTPTEAQLRQLMMRGLDPRQGASGLSPPPPYAGGNPFLGDVLGAGAGPGQPDQDPMVNLLTQMLAGGSAAGGVAGANNPFAAAGARPGGGFGIPGLQQAPGQSSGPAPGSAIPDAYATVWRVLHLVVAMCLGLYIALFSGFTGTKPARDRAALAASVGVSGEDVEDDQKRHVFFWAFATAEAVLLTSRFFLDRARAPPSGILWTVAGFLPPTVKGYLETGLRYSQIFTTVRSDLLVCVFVLGVCFWLRAP